jgi:hypothetical protein
MPGLFRNIYAAVQQFGAAFLSVSALFLSLYNLYDSKRTQDLVARTEALKTEYGIYTDLTKLAHDNPFLSHLLLSQSPAAYYLAVTRIKTALKDMTPTERIKLVLEERAIAHYIFTVYEETYYQWQSATEANSDTLAGLLLEHLKFFNGFLCNSRLLWYWNNSLDPQYQYFSSDLVSYYDANVSHDCRVTPDPSGPLRLTAP